MDLKEKFEGKKVYVKLISDRIYTGFCKEVVYIGKNEYNADIFMFHVLDKYGQMVVFSNNEIKFMESEK